MSSLALRTRINFPSRDVSFINLHKQCQKSTHEQFMMYQLSINAYKSLNENVQVPTLELVRLLDQIICPRRQTLLDTLRNNRFKIGMNTNANKVYHIRKKIVLDKLSWSFPRFKKHMKLQFLKFGNT